mgnify:FL=1
MTFIEKFEAIEKKMKNIEADALKEEFAIQVTMNDKDCGGTFYVANIGGDFNVKPYNYYDNTVAIVCAAKDFIDLIGGKADFEKSVAENKIEVYGNEEHAKLLEKLVKKPAKRTVKKPAAKKPAAAKPAAKKTVQKVAAEVKKEETKPLAAEKKTEVKKAADKKIK